MQIPLEPDADGDDDAATRCLQSLAGLNTDCLLTFYAMISMAFEADGYVTDSVSQLARRRGWNVGSLDSRSRSGSPTRRERLREHLRLLTNTEIVFTDPKDEVGRFVALPLLRTYARAGDADRGQRQSNLVVYDIHPVLWRELTCARRAFFYDRDIMTADVKKDEWSIRLLWYMSARWGPNWVSKQLDRTGGRMTERLGVLLAGAGIEFRNQLREQGRPWLRRVFRVAMNKLRNWKPDPLIGGYKVKERGSDPLEDRVTFWPTKAVASQHNLARSKAIASRDTKQLAAGGSPTRRRRSVTAG